MTTLAIEINDVGLRAARLDGGGTPVLVGAPSPGYALLGRARRGDGALVTGEPALKAARLDPRYVSHRHWDRMNLDPVGRPFPGALRQADLVHAHLAAYRAGLAAEAGAESAGVPGGAPVLFAVPGCWSAEQIGLLVGIARSLEMPVIGLVDAGPAACTAMRSAARVLHVDVLLHRAVLTVLDTGAPRRARVGVSDVEGAGLLDFQRLWVEAIARRFVRETRFDPLHRGDSEQALHDRLPGWLAELHELRRATLALAPDRSIEITREDLVSAGRDPIEAITRAALAMRPEGPSTSSRSGPMSLALSARAARLPGLGEHLAGRLAEHRGDAGRTPPTVLPDGAAAIGALRHQDAIAVPGQRLPLVVELPLDEALPGAPSREESAVPDPAASHV